MQLSGLDLAWTLCRSVMCNTKSPSRECDMAGLTKVPSQPHALHEAAMLLNCSPAAHAVR